MYREAEIHTITGGYRIGAEGLEFCNPPQLSRRAGEAYSLMRVCGGLDGKFFVPVSLLVISTRISLLVACASPDCMHAAINVTSFPPSWHH